MNVSGTRGRRQTFQYGDETLSITELLRKPEVVGYLEKDGPLTYASQREKLRRLLRSGRINQQLITEHIARNPQQPPRVQDTRYATQRRRANLPRRTTKGEVLFGPEPPPRAHRRPPSAIVINGENLTARQTLERHPQLRELLQQGRKVSEKSLRAKVRTWIRKGKIPNHVFNPEPEIVPRERLLGNVIGHHTIHSKGNTSPKDFLNFTRNVVIRFLRERLQNKVQLSLICVMMRVDPATGQVTNEEQASFNSRQEPIFGSTDLEEVYERMVAKMLEAFATYLKNGSGWMLKKVVRLDITLSRLRPLRGSSHIPLPERILKRKALINMENEDKECFKWAVTKVLNPVEKKPQRVTKELRKQSEELDWSGIEFPSPCLERVFKKFEKNNVRCFLFGVRARGCHK